MKKRIIFVSTIFLVFNLQSLFSQPTFTVRTFPMYDQIVFEPAIGSITVNDMNGDGFKDIISINHSPGNISCILGNGQGGFGAPTLYPTRTGNRYGVSIDINGDGKRDVFTSTSSAFSSSSSSAWFTFLGGTGSGSFGPAAIGVSVTTCGERIMKAADVDNDGKEDIVIAEYPSLTLTSPRISVFKIANNGTIPTPNHYALPKYPTDVCVADLNNDGFKDIAVTLMENGTGTIAILLNNGFGGFGTPAYYSSCKFNPLGINAGDFNGDGNIDIVAGHSDRIFSILIGQGDGTLNPCVTYSAMTAEIPAAADFDGDGKTDLVFGTRTSTSSGVQIMRGNGDGTFSTGPLLNAFADRIEIVDLNADGKPDIVGHQAKEAVVLVNTSNPYSPASVKGNLISNTSLKIFSKENELFIQNAQELDLKISDITGKTILVTELNANNEYKTSIKGLTSGIYIISGKDAFGTVNRKILIE